MMRLIGLAVAVLWSGSVAAASLEPKVVTMEGNTLRAQFDLSHLGQDCGLRVRFGDGAEQKIRVGRDVNERDFSVEHAYQGDGGFILEVEGKTIKKGLGTVFGCEGDVYRKAVCIGK